MLSSLNVITREINECYGPDLSALPGSCNGHAEASLKSCEISQIMSNPFGKRDGQTWFDLSKHLHLQV